MTNVAWDGLDEGGYCASFRKSLCCLFPFCCFKSKGDGADDYEYTEYEYKPPAKTWNGNKAIEEPKPEQKQAETAADPELSNPLMDLPARKSSLHSRSEVKRRPSPFDKLYLKHRALTIRRALDRPGDVEELLGIVRLEDQERIRDLQSQNSAYQIRISVLENQLKTAESPDESGAEIPCQKEALVTHTLNNLLQQQQLLRQAAIDRKVVDTKKQVGSAVG